MPFDACIKDRLITARTLGCPKLRWGALNFFRCRCVRPGFPNLCGAWELIFASDREGACELKISKFGGLWTKFSEFRGLWAESFQIWRLEAKTGWAKIKAVKAKISEFSQKGVFWTDTFAWNGTLANYRRGVKRRSSGSHIPIPPFLVSAPRGHVFEILLFGSSWKYEPKLFFKT